MIYVGTSKGFSFSVNDHGAELCSLCGPDGTEYIWQADASVWAKHAPILFPIVGRLCNDNYCLGGQTRTMKQHGFARDLDFKLIQRESDALKFRLVATDLTRRQYPFDFVLDVGYRLDGAALTITYEVRNPNDTVLPFSIGAHPAFACSWESGDTVDCYYLEFEKSEDVRTVLLDGGLFTREKLPVLHETRELALNAHTFDRDAIILLDHRSRAITLHRRNTSRSLTVSFDGFPALGIWSKPGAPFVCIEPWIGHADPVEPYGDFVNKPDLLHLAAGRTFSCAYSVIIGE